MSILFYCLSILNQSYGLILQRIQRKIGKQMNQGGSNWMRTDEFCEQKPAKFWLIETHNQMRMRLCLTFLSTASSIENVCLIED